MNNYMTWDDELALSHEHPRPTLQRRKWLSLDGEWAFAIDSQDCGLSERWFERFPLQQNITVPFPPESQASGVYETSFDTRVVWYSRALSKDEIADLSSTSAGSLGSLLLHFGAVDFHAVIWVNGHRIAEHFGGNSPFTVDVSDYAGSNDVAIVVRASDHPLDVEKHRGKQDWHALPHAIWYERTTGIWQSAWIESVPALHIQTLAITPNLQDGTVQLELALSDFPIEPITVAAEARYLGSTLGESSARLETQSARLILPLSIQRNGQGYEDILWTPETPRLLDLQIQLSSNGRAIDSVASYVGLRSIGYESGHFMLNDRPYYMRSVLNQGYQTKTHLAAPSVDDLRKEIELIKSFGFNSARLHQKIEDPRIAFFADAIGLLLWVEMPSAYTTSLLAQKRFLLEWPAIVERFRNHPSVMAWVPFNESWGIQHVAHEPSTQHYVQAMWHLTKALDPSRLVISNDGWELLDSDVWSIHDYEANGQTVLDRYRTEGDVERVLSGVGPAGRRMRIGKPQVNGQPAMLTEFGGITFAPNSAIETWGYSVAQDSEDFEQRLTSLVNAVHESAFAGFCYTQLRDTLQEANGLVDAEGVPKLAPEVLHNIFGK